MKDKTDAANPMEDKKNPMSDMAEQVVKNYEQALRSGLKMQQEAGQWWSNWAAQSAPPTDWQKRFTSYSTVVNEFVPATGKRMEEVLDLMERNTRTGTELLRKAADAAQAPVIADSQAKWMEFWTSSLGAVRSSGEAIAQINGKAIDAWIDFVQKNTEVTQIRVPKAA
jgi:hypothetical protein